MLPYPFECPVDGCDLQLEKGRSMAHKDMREHIERWHSNSEYSIRDDARRRARARRRPLRG